MCCWFMTPCCLLSQRRSQLRLRSTVVFASPAALFALRCRLPRDSLVCVKVRSLCRSRLVSCRVTQWHLSMTASSLSASARCCQQQCNWLQRVRLSCKRTPGRSREQHLSSRIQVTRCPWQTAHPAQIALHGRVHASSFRNPMQRRV
jgi:hypothetical protein